MGQNSFKALENNAGEIELEWKPSFLTIPQEIRLKIFNDPAITFEERQSLRMVCKTFAREIDEFVGCADIINLSDNRSRQALNYFGQSVIPALDILQSSILKFNRVIYKPNCLQSFRLFNNGIVTPEFMHALLLNCTNLKTLGCIGNIQGSIPDDGNIITLPELTTLHIDAENMASSFLVDSYIGALINFFRGRPYDLNSILAFWDNQRYLLRRLQCPKLEDATLILYTFDNFRMEYDDEVELAFDLMDFLKRHPNCKNLKVFHGKQYVDRNFQYEHSINYYKSRGNNYPRRLTLPSEIDLKVTEFTFASKMDHGHTDSKLETYVLELVKSLKHLESLQLKITSERLLHWRTLWDIIVQNGNSLRRLEITAKFEGSVDFNVFRQCGNLKVLKLKHKYKYWSYYPSLIIENFGPHPIMVDNLESLILQNFGLKNEDFESICKFKKLKQLAFNWWKGTEGLYGMTLQGVQNIIQMESIHSLLLPLGLSHFDVEEWDAVNEFAKDVLIEYFYPDKSCLLERTRFICMSKDLHCNAIGKSTRCFNSLWKNTEWGFEIQCGHFPLPKIYKRFE